MTIDELIENLQKAKNEVNIGAHPRFTGEVTIYDDTHDKHYVVKNFNWKSLPCQCVYGVEIEIEEKTQYENRTAKKGSDKNLRSLDEIAEDWSTPAYLE